ncbi:methylmalonyl-CoA epimerase [Neobacillus bataviensis LMG 21833]|uniref:Methylmalonyl-CoA epimerase n=1 Tax=Neobacillus bataviensis LMG 21833 TaxID=1117379 RepID=K6DF86_9BACI|nr:VOC family protein [Neobacillus bataviensis]EKN66969.1 methylmalonyl-CoA epimerase [Neobacillus bataviensis LMG 21833]
MIENWKLDHITMGVLDYQAAANKFTNVFGGSFLKEVSLDSLGAMASYLSFGQVVVGMESPTRENSDIDRFIKRKGEGLHHIAFSVEDIQGVEHQLREKGLRLIGPEVEEGVKTDLFIHPKSCFGVLVQLTEWEEPYKSSFEKRVEILGEHE